MVFESIKKLPTLTRVYVSLIYNQLLNAETLLIKRKKRKSESK